MKGNFHLIKFTMSVPAKDKGLFSVYIACFSERQRLDLVKTVKVWMLRFSVSNGTCLGERARSCRAWQNSHCKGLVVQGERGTQHVMWADNQASGWCKIIKTKKHHYELEDAAVCWYKVLSRSKDSMQTGIAY